MTMRARAGAAAVTVLCAAAAVAATTVSAGASPAAATRPAWGGSGLVAGNLLVSESRYTSVPDLVPGQTQLPPGCTSGNCVTATASGDYPEVFNNALVDGSFGVTEPIFLAQITPSGRPLSTFEVPPSELVTSFSSKSELALNLSTDGKTISFMGYIANPGALDVSNSNTPGVIDPTNPVPGAYYRAVAQLSRNGKFRFTETNAYSGNNGRAAITAGKGRKQLIYTSGNAGNGSSPQPPGVILGAGAQLITPGAAPGTPTPVGSFNITQLGYPADKIGKDDNFRGLTIFNNVLYYTKGSGGNGVNTVYFLDTTGKACPNGVGLPAAGAKLPTSPLSYDPATLQTTGLPSNMCILKGFNTVLAKTSTDSFPFGVWFANPDTLYVADEGSGTNTFSGTFANGEYTAAAAQTKAGLQKWVFDGTEWKLAYTLQAGLNLGQPYTVPGYPTGTNAATKLPWAPGTDGLRNITGQVNRNGTATIWAITSTVSGSGDQGADPNKLVEITDPLAATAPASWESFRTVRAAGFGEVLRGVSFTPGTRGW